MAIDTLPFVEGPEVPPNIDSEEWWNKVEEIIPEPDILRGVCYSCRFQEQELFYPNDEKDLGDAKEKLRQKHQSAFSGCPGKLQFGAY